MVDLTGWASWASAVGWTEAAQPAACQLLLGGSPASGLFALSAAGPPGLRVAVAALRWDGQGQVGGDVPLALECRGRDGVVDLGGALRYRPAAARAALLSAAPVTADDGAGAGAGGGVCVQFEPCRLTLVLTALPACARRGGLELVAPAGQVTNVGQRIRS